ncbi:hypothetical protein OEZ86_006677 [Tetradesmus obliquus]|nr:hypothetical protein OEZ86_006677 [Tetradesmus obliquus]
MDVLVLVLWNRLASVPSPRQADTCVSSSGRNSDQKFAASAMLTRQLPQAGATSTRHHCCQHHGQVKLVCRGRAVQAAAAPSRCRTGTIAGANQRQGTQDPPGVEDDQQVQQSGGPFGALVDFFLNRASSSLTRGTATCLTCKGVGACECPLCKGAGIMDKEASRMNTMRHAAQKMKQVLHVDRANYNTEWLQTNRCRRCHGAGRVACPTCGGLGVRTPGVKPPKQ